MDGAFKYKAFISYSHKDAKFAGWLHRRLENYRLPKSKIGAETPRGQVPKNLKPIFRDRDELTAGASLGAVIEEALTQSENLIVICSPNSANSHWVNQEVLFFKKLGRETNIIPVVIDGEPFASNLPHRREDEAFPEALRFELGDDGELSDQPAEPLAADLRPDGDGRRLGTLKLISGLAGLGLDDLVQRDLQRARRRVMWITGAAASILLVMGSLTWIAIDARGEAEQRRADAEGQIEFMLTDLKEKLDEVGRLDILQAVGERAVDYYYKYDIAEHDDDALGRRARAFHLIGDLEDKLGNPDKAEAIFAMAYESTESQLQKAPRDPDRIYDHAQSSFWVGKLHFKAGRYRQTEKYYQEYLELAVRLNEVEGASLRSRQEYGYALNNLADLANREGREREALEINLKSLPIVESIALEFPDNADYQFDLADLYRALARSTIELDGLKAAETYSEKELNHFLATRKRHPQNYFILQRTITAYIGAFNRSAELGLYKEARLLFDEMLKLTEKLLDNEPNDTRNLIISEFVLHRGARLEIIDENFEKAENFIRRAEKASEKRGENSQREFVARFHNPVSRLIFRLIIALHAENIDEAKGYLDQIKQLTDENIRDDLNEAERAELSYTYLIYAALIYNESEYVRQFLDGVSQEGEYDLSVWRQPDLDLMIHHFGIDKNEFPNIQFSEPEYSSNRIYWNAYRKLYGEPTFLPN